MPTVFRRTLPNPCSGGKGSKVRIRTELNIANTAHPRICTQVGKIGMAIHHAVAKSSTPKSFFTPSIQGPALGRSLPADTPMTNSGRPMPQAMLNSAEPPSQTSPVCEI